jgi:hypothetical protein
VILIDASLIGLPIHRSKHLISSATATGLLGKMLVTRIAAPFRRLPPYVAIAARADYEYAAVMRGDNWRGTFGRYQPAPWWRA